MDLARPDEVSGPAAHALTLRYRSGTPGDAEEVATLLEVENGRRADLGDELRGLLGAWPSVLAHDGDRLVGAFYSRGFSPDMIELRNTIVAAEHRRAGVGAEMAGRFEAETPPPFTITPRRAARETPEISAIGAARISGHGVATTITATKRTASPDTAQAIPAIASTSGRKKAA